MSEMQTRPRPASASAVFADSTMAFLQWRRFQFFDRETLKSTTESSHEMTESLLLESNAISSDDIDLSDSNAILEENLVPSSTSAIDRLADIRIICYHSGHGYLMIGDDDGLVHLIDRQFNHESFRAYDHSCSLIKCVTSESSDRPDTFIVTVGSDDPDAKFELIKVWNLNKWITHEDGTKPHCFRTCPTSPTLGANRTVAKATCITVAEQLNYLALGFFDGTILIIRNDITREKLAKQRIIPVTDSPITNIEFGDVSVTSYRRMDINTLLNNMERGPSAVLFVSTASNIFSFTIRKDREEKCILDTEGALPGCAMCIPDTKRLRPVSVSGSPTAASSLPAKLFAVGRGDAVYFYQSDERGQCLAFDGDKSHLAAFNSFLVTIGPEKRSYHPLSTDSANKLPSSDASQPETAPITPMLQFYNVTIYDLVNRLIAFTTTVASVKAVFTEWGIVFIVTAKGELIQLKEKDNTSKLRLLFRKSQFSLAMDLAKSYNFREEEIADITRQYADQLYKNGEYDASVAQFIKTIGHLEPSYVIRKFLDSRRILNLTSYLKALLERDVANEDHTTLLINCHAKLGEDKQLNELIAKGLEFDVETVIKVLRNSGFSHHASQLALKASKIDSYLSTQLDDLDSANSALKFFMNSVEKRHQLWYLIQYGRKFMAKLPDETATLVKDVISQFIEDPSAFSLPSDRLFKLEDSLNIYLNHANHLLQFLEYIVDKYPIQTPALFYQTLLDLYLQKFASTRDVVKGSIFDDDVEAKLMVLIKSPHAKYDEEQALLQCHLYKFTPGLLYFYKKTGRESLIQQFYIKDHNAQGVVDSAVTPQMVSNALWYFSEHPGTPEQISSLLRKVEQDKLIPALEVIRILSMNPCNILSGVRDFLFAWFSDEERMITKNHKDILENEEETDKRKKEITEMTGSPRIFQSSRCSICSRSLELPAIHFYCGHSFHQNCFESYSDFDCFLCARENRQILDLLKNRTKRDLNDRIIEQLARPGSDPVTNLASLIAKGVFSSKN